MIGQWITWTLLVILVGWSAFPIAFRLLGRLADRGYVLVKALGLLIWGYLFWLLASIGVFPNTPGSIFFSLLLVCGLSVLCLRNGGWTEIRAWLRQNGKRVLTIEVIFLLTFAFWAFIRSTNPEISGTEKPMEMAFINAILRSETFPPHDPWLSGYSISYYYFGYVMVAMITKVVGTDPGVAFNLAGALWFSLTAVSAFGIGANLFASWQEHRRVKAGQITSGQPVAAGLLTAFFILIISNIEGFLEMLHARGVFWKQLPDNTWSSPFWRWIDLQELVEPPVQPFSWVPERVTGIWWWRASRVLQDYDAAGLSKEIIDEFPFFSYFLADLHPHVLAMPFALLAIGFSLNLFLGGWRLDQSGTPLHLWLQTWWKGEKFHLNEIAIVRWLRQPEFWLGAVIFGGLAFLNTWDFPIYVAIFGATIALLVFQKMGWSWKLILLFLRVCVGIGILGVILYLPFYLGFSSQAGGIIPSIHFFTRGVHLWIMFLPLLGPILVWLIWSSRNGLHLDLRSGLRLAAIVVFGLWLLSYLLGFMIGVLPLVGNVILNSGVTSPILLRLADRSLMAGNAFLGVQGSTGLADLIGGSMVRRLLQPGAWISLFAFLGLTIGYLWGNRKSTSDAPENADKNGQTNPTHFALLVFLVGLGLVIVPEFFYLRDQFGWRINTIFKFYFQAWILWSIMAAFSLTVLWQSLRSWKIILFRIVMILVILAGLAYPAFALADRLATPLSQLTLDGTNNIARYNPDEMAAIIWLRQAPLGVLVEAVGGSYSAYARFSTHSGQPTVLGWPGHESQWRGGAREIGTREGDVERLYRTKNWEEAQQLLHQYNVTYVVIGSLERNRYRADDQFFQQHLQEVFRQGEVVIFRFDGS